MDITLLAIDIAKNVFQLHGNDVHGKCVFKKRLSRSKLAVEIANLPECTIVMEACGSASYWHRKFTAMGHVVKLISPQYVKPFVKTNKNDANDAEAIAEAASRPSMRYVKPKTLEQQDIQSLHKIRSRLVKNKTQLANQVRGLLLEYGITINQSHTALRERLPGILEDIDNDLTPLTRELVQGLYDEFIELTEKVKVYDRRVKQIVQTQESCQRLLEIEGIGELTATAIISTMGDPRYFKNGRNFAAYLGLVPKQSSSGEKSKLLSISKRGNVYLRTLLIHGARAVIAASSGKSDRKSQWIQEKIRRSGYCKTLVSLANKTARTAWSLMANGTRYDINFKQVI
ncbi:IS110 family transposase [Thiotrichales bacterium 19X7-9]|nr:IS110 family transposase [Thiotrichales bacterium 19X7-9]